ncbi:hypothetical protein FHQ28_05425 [Pasteurellaceae bacterium USgator11]|nr:hypothetical protein FHQ19_09370 [Pasteurellaceae bacterium UScroc12]TNG94756.1 hypothetical protein FHQ20_08165 [Pasteurellaceae bacterium USgator41]TNG97727.1 hypothetical protein FHQ24_09955 [Pasteurellaceae bacterium UScroc31]TNH01688.1 hypothetical protein FHQ28_05425 [Pasteurellaceae bacterium USgator11]
MARTKKTFIEYQYQITAHEKGLGFYAYEHHRGRTTGWRSNNHCAEELCETEIKRRQDQRRAQQGLPPVYEFGFNPHRTYGA